MNTYKMVCDHCGSHRIVVDADARWDSDEQRWTIDALHADRAHCEDCEAATELCAEPLDWLTHRPNHLHAYLDESVIARIAQTRHTGPARHLFLATIGLTAGDIMEAGMSAKGNTP